MHPGRFFFSSSDWIIGCCSGGANVRSNSHSPFNLVGSFPFLFVCNSFFGFALLPVAVNDDPSLTNHQLAFSTLVLITSPRSSVRRNVGAFLSLSLDISTHPFRNIRKFGKIRSKHRKRLTAIRIRTRHGLTCPASHCPKSI